MSYFKQIDSVRAFAVGLVIISHWFPEDYRIYKYSGVFNGVDIFFVLSGFLITRILLESRNKAEELNLSKAVALKYFFARRVLRIFPIYYLLLLLLYAFGDATGTDIRDSILYFVTYTSNFYFFSIQGWDGMLSHLWSLSVEEQFYLIWPGFMLFLKKKWLLPAILSSIIIGVSSQILLRNVFLSDWLTFSCLDGFGLGALLAWVLVYQPSVLTKASTLSFYAAMLCFALLALKVVYSGSLSLIPARTLTSVFTVWVLMNILQNSESKSFIYRYILNNPALVFIGKISYGIYLYHLGLPFITNNLLRQLNGYLPIDLARYSVYLLALENFGILLLISYLSWRLIETPLLKLKKKYDYQQVITVSQQKSTV